MESEFYYLSTEIQKAIDGNFISYFAIPPHIIVFRCTPNSITLIAHYILKNFIFLMDILINKNVRNQKMQSTARFKSALRTDCNVSADCRQEIFNILNNITVIDSDQ